MQSMRAAARAEVCELLLLPVELSGWGQAAGWLVWHRVPAEALSKGWWQHRGVGCLLTGQVCVQEELSSLPKTPSCSFPCT